MCDHLFGGTGFLGLGHGGWVHAVEDLGGIAATAFLGPVVGSALGVGDIAGAGLVGAGVGALKGAVQGGNPLVGALEGGAISAGLAGVGDALGGGGASGAATGSPAVGGAGASAAGAAAPASVGADLPLGINPDTGAPVFSPANVAAATTGPGFGAAPDTGGAVFAPSGSASGATFTGFADTAPTAATPGVGALPGANPDTGAPIFAPSGPSSIGQDIYSGFSNVSNALTGAPSASSGVGDTTLTPTSDTTTGAVSPGNTLSNAYGATGTLPAQSNAFTNQVLGGNIPQTGGGGVSVGGTGGTGAGNFISNLTSGNIPGAVSAAGSDIGAAGSALTANPALALGGALLGYDVLKGNQVPKGYNAINAEATQLGQQATQLEGYLTSGTLPPGVATALQQAASSAKAAIRSQYAARGESGSSAEQADLANVDNTVVSQGASIATNLLNSGVNEAGLASQLYGQIMNYSLQSDAQLTQALSVLAAASARPTTVTLAGTNS
jgi:hypothetical protein